MLAPQVLAQLPLLHNISPATLAVLARHAVERSYGADEVLWAAGAERRGLFIVRSGRVRVVRGRGDRQHVVHVEGAGGILGEVVVRGLRALGRSGAIRSLGGGRYEVTCRETLRTIAEQ